MPLKDMTNLVTDPKLSHSKQWIFHQKLRQVHTTHAVTFATALGGRSTR